MSEHIVITRRQFEILNSLADGFEPFSMIYSDIQEEISMNITVAEAAIDLCKLIQLKLVVQTEGEESLTPDELTNHYNSLRNELKSCKKPFYYSKGEYFFEMTYSGRNIWDAWEEI